MSKFFDPVPVVCKPVKDSRGIAVLTGSNGDSIPVKYRGETHVCKVAGQQITAGEPVSVVILENEKFAIAESGGYDSTFRRKLSDLSPKFGANLAIRKLLDRNQKDYLYRTANIISFDGTSVTADVGDPYNATLPVKFGANDAGTSAGIGLVCETSDANRHVVGYSSDDGFGGLIPNSMFIRPSVSWSSTRHYGGMLNLKSMVNTWQEWRPAPTVAWSPLWEPAPPGSSAWASGITPPDDRWLAADGTMTTRILAWPSGPNLSETPKVWRQLGDSCNISPAGEWQIFGLSVILPETVWVKDISTSKYFEFVGGAWTLKEFPSDYYYSPTIMVPGLGNVVMRKSETTEEVTGAINNDPWYWGSGHDYFHVEFYNYSHDVAGKFQIRVAPSWTAGLTSEQRSWLVPSNMPQTTYNPGTNTSESVGWEWDTESVKAGGFTRYGSPSFTDAGVSIAETRTRYWYWLLGGVYTLFTNPVFEIRFIPN